MTNGSALSERERTVTGNEIPARSKTLSEMQDSPAHSSSRRITLLCDMSNLFSQTVAIQNKRTDKEKRNQRLERRKVNTLKEQWVFPKWKLPKSLMEQKI